MKLGLIVNPVAGLGGAVGLKGTDGPGTVARALERGAVARSGPRARQALRVLAQRHPGLRIATVSGALGANWAKGLDLALDLRSCADATGTARDTRIAVAALADCDLLLFAGGDGTARDVAACLGPGQAMLGVPCGVKMHSGVFAVTPEAAGALVADALDATDRVAWDDRAEIMDIDEDALRAGRLAPRLYGHARAPKSRGRVQASKGGPRKDWGAILQGAAAEVAAGMDPGTVYVIGPGTSAGAVARALDLQPSVLGSDAILDRRMVARDATAAELERVAADRPVRIVLGVTGRQGFLLGRGNLQIGPGLIARAGREGLIVLAGEEKLAALAQPVLWVDTGEPELDRALAGFVRVKTGRGRETMMRIASG